MTRQKRGRLRGRQRTGGGCAQVRLREERGCSRICAISSQALSAGATELADDFAAHGQKRLTGLPACQLSPLAPSERAGGGKHRASRSASPAEIHRAKVDSGSRCRTTPAVKLGFAYAPDQTMP